MAVGSKVSYPIDKFDKVLKSVRRLNKASPAYRWVISKDIYTVTVKRTLNNLTRL